MDSKRTILAVVLSVIVLYAYSYFLPQKPSQKPAVPVMSAVTSSTVKPSAVSLQPAVMQNVSATAQDIVVETDNLKIVFTTQGALVKSVSLKNYRQSAAIASTPVILFSFQDPSSMNIQSVSTAIGLTPATLYNPSKNNLSVSGSNQQELEFTALLPSGVVVKKIYTISGSGYTVGIEHQILNSSVQNISGSLKLLLAAKSVQDSKSDLRYELYEAALLSNGKAIHVPAKDIIKENKTIQSVNWSGFGDKYFISAILATAQSPFKSVELSSAAGSIFNTVQYPDYSLSPSAAASFKSRLYLGPKDLDILKAVGVNLEESMDLGWFAVIAKPFLLSLKFLHSYVGNYGLAIIIITVILKLLFYPLTFKSYKSMKSMQKLQPQMEKIKEKHKDDRNVMNQEVMKLYQQHKVNPLGGCLPMIVQIPVFFALYKALMFSIELRHAPFYFWITDLSSKDPYYVTPIIMGATMFIQQKMTPTSMDPVQAKVMLMLPVVFTFMFLNFPSGLVIYWLVNNILSIAQQYYINKAVAV